MVERQRQDSSRDLLEELEDGWMTPAPPPAAAAASTNGEPRSQASSDPDVDSLDAGWLDDLFPGDEDDSDDDEDDEPEESEPELPDERLDPEAFALAKKARDERAARRKEKKRAKLEAKRARQKARAAAMRQRQKAKKGRSAPRPQESGGRRDRAPTSEREPSTTDATHAEAGPSEDEADALAAAGVPAPKPRPRKSPRRPSTLASIRLLAIVLGVMLALAALVATIAK